MRFVPASLVEGFAETLGCALPGEFAEIGHRGAAFGADFFGVFVFDLVEREAGAAAGDGDGAGDCFRVRREKAGHFGCGFEVAFAVLKEELTGLGNAGGVTDAGDDILQSAPGGFVIVYIVGGDEGNVCVVRKRCELLKRAMVFRGIEATGGEREAIIIEGCAE